MTEKNSLRPLAAVGRNGKHRATMYALVKATAEKFPSAIAVDFMGRTITYQSLLAEIDRVAAFLTGLGLKKGDVITIALPNMPSAAEIFYAANRIGIIANIVHPLVPVKQLISYMEKTGSKIAAVLSLAFQTQREAFEEKGITAIVCSPADALSPIVRAVFNQINRKKLAGIKPSNTVIPFRKISEYAMSAVVDCEVAGAVSIYLHSGGTTGEPKTIALSDTALNNLALHGKFIIGTDDIIGKGMLGVLPIFHGFGLCMCMHTMFVNGCVSVLLPQFDVKAVIKAIARGRVQMIAGVPTMYEKLLQNKRFSSKHLKNLEFAFCGGDCMPKILKTRFDALVESVGGKCKMFEGYGLTETVTVCAVNTYANNRDGSMGQALPRMEIFAVDTSSHQKLPSGELGEIAVFTDTAMTGYLDDEQATNDTIIDRDEERSLVLTGDYGYVDEDGFVFFKQRLKRIIKVSGVAVFPSEIEDHAAHVAGVIRACAVGVPHEKVGHTVRLYVEKQAGEDECALKERITEHLKKNVISWAVPRQIVFIDKLPLTMIGKVDNRKLEQAIEKEFSE